MGDASVLARLAEQQALLTGPANAAEKFYDSIGLMRAPWSPVGRMAVGFGLGSAVMWAARPSFAFAEDGRPLDMEDATVPWWVLPAVLGVYSGVFV